MRFRALLASLLVAAAAWAEASVPPSLQATTFAKIFGFDRALDRQRLEVLVAYDPRGGGRGDAVALQEAFRDIAITADPVAAADAGARLRPGVVLYLLPGAATAELLAAAATAHALTIAGDATLAEQGKVSVGLAQRGDRAEIVVNLDRVAREEHDFAAQLLQFARVVHGGQSGGGTAVAPPLPADVTTPPVLVGISRPTYPSVARQLHLQGEVVMRLSVDENGRVTAVELVRGVGRGGLDEAALAAARSARFRPATRNGVAVAGTYLLTMPFRL